MSVCLSVCLSLSLSAAGMKMLPRADPHLRTLPRHREGRSGQHALRDGVASRRIVFLEREAGKAARAILTQPRRDMGAAAEGPALRTPILELAFFLTSFRLGWVRPKSTYWANTARWSRCSESSRGAAPLFLIVTCCNSFTSINQKKAVAESRSHMQSDN